MKQKVVLLFSLCLCSAILHVNAQTVSPEKEDATGSWQKTYGETDFYNRGNSVCQTPDGGFAIAGRTVNFKAGGVNAYLIRTDAAGIVLWTKEFGGKGSEEVNAVKVTNDGGFILAGYTNSSGAGGTDFQLIKTDANGEQQWMKTYGGTGIDRAYDVEQTTDGGYIITGETYSFGAGWVNAYLVRTDSNGDTLWTQVYGGNGIEESYSVGLTSDGGFILTGATNSFGAGDYDVYLIRTDKDGEILWTNAFGGTGSEEGYAVQQTSDGGYIVTGYTTSFGMGGHDMYLLKTDAKGNELWAKTFGGRTDDHSMSVLQTKDGGYTIAGYTNSFGSGGVDVYLVHTDENGERMWSRTYGKSSDDYGKCVKATSDGGYVIAGSSVSAGSTGLQGEKIKEIYLIKTDGFGN